MKLYILTIIIRSVCSTGVFYFTVTGRGGKKMGIPMMLWNPMGMGILPAVFVGIGLRIKGMRVEMSQGNGKERGILMFFTKFPHFVPI